MQSIFTTTKVKYHCWWDNTYGQLNITTVLDKRSPLKHQVVSVSDKRNTFVLDTCHNLFQHLAQKKNRHLGFYIQQQQQSSDRGVPDLENKTCEGRWLPIPVRKALEGTGGINTTHFVKLHSGSFLLTFFTDSWDTVTLSNMFIFLTWQKM